MFANLTNLSSKLIPLCFNYATIDMMCITKRTMYCRNSKNNVLMVVRHLNIIGFQELDKRALLPLLRMAVQVRLYEE